ncbi:MAG TPA: hypothetical protein VGD12_05490 [Blastococcus sp.]|jgi:hypothetical protein
MIRLLPLTAVVGAAFLVPQVRARVAWFLARAGRGTQVGVAPAPHRR